MARSTSAQKSERLNAAHRLLAGGARVADAAALLANECGISLRHAYRLHRRSTGFEKARSNSGRVDADNVQTSGRYNRASARLFGDNWNHIERNRNARNKSLSLLCKQEWLRAGNRSLLMSILTTSSTVCSFTNCNKRMRSWFPIMFASREVKWSERLTRTRLGPTYARVS